MVPIILTLWEKGGHRIYHKVTPTFRPWCAVCKAGYTDWFDTEQRARQALWDHLDRGVHDWLD